MGALDNTYTRHWEEYYLADGTTKDSRYVYWRDLEWEKVVKIVLNVRNVRYEETIHPNHKAFIRYRTREYRTGAPLGRTQIDRWVFGWTDGDTCYLREIDFKTGKLVREFTAPLKGKKAHLHPRVKRELVHLL